MSDDRQKVYEAAYEVFSRFVGSGAMQEAVDQALHDTLPGALHDSLENKWRDTLSQSAAELRMVRDVLEELGPVGILPSVEQCLAPGQEGAALVEAIRKLFDTRPAAPVEARGEGEAEKPLRHHHGGEVRPSVVRFARLMETQLRRNDSRGGWSNCDRVYFMEKLTINLNDLGHDLRAGAHEAVQRDCADLGNFAMMLAENEFMWYCVSLPEPAPVSQGAGTEGKHPNAKPGCDNCDGTGYVKAVALDQHGDGKHECFCVFDEPKQGAGTVCPECGGPMGDMAHHPNCPNKTAPSAKPAPVSQGNSPEIPDSSQGARHDHG